MRKFFVAALGVLAVAGAASAQQPQFQYVTPGAPGQVPAGALTPTAGTSPMTPPGVVTPPGYSSTPGYWNTNCQYGSGCQNGCGSLKSDAAFVFGSCRNFFNPCGPVCGSHGGGLFGHKCGSLGFASPYGIGWQCPRQYDSYANH